jgi:ribosomal-protein-alanine N-acetyltransferase
MIYADELILKPTEIADLEQLFQFQLDEEAGYLAAFMPKSPADKTAYLEKMTSALNNPAIHTRTIWMNGNIVGSVAKYEMEGNAEITYWIDKPFWGKGIATKALQTFLMVETARPIFGRIAFDNFGSQRVLEKCGFEKVGNDRGFANARQTEIEEFVYQLR